MTTDHEDERFSPDGPDGHIDPNDAEPIEGAAFDPGDADEAITPQADYVRRRDLREQRKREALASSATPAKSSATAVYQLPYGNIASNLVDLRKKLFRPGELTLGRTKSDRLWGWLGPLLVTLFGFVLRVWNLGYPHKLVFDETHYVKHAWTLLQIGYEAEWPKDYDSQFNVGKVMGFETKPAFIVHPQLGKWLIAIGMKFLGGDNPWGWRIMVCLFGTATIWLVARAGRHLFGSTKLGILAGFLFAIDGQAIVHARYALLDGFWCSSSSRPSRRSCWTEPTAATGWPNESPLGWTKARKSLAGARSSVCAGGGWQPVFYWASPAR